MSNTNVPNARSSRASRKRARAPGNDPAPGAQPSQKRQKPNPSRQTRKRAAKRGRDAAARGRQPAPGGAGYLDSDTRLQHTIPEMDDVLEKDEFVADVLGSNGAGNAVITKYAVNPGQAALFPLGSSEAAKWTCWKCVYCEPYLMHEVSQTAADGQTGKVILAMDYNAANDVPTTKQQLEALHSASCMPYQDIGLNLVPKLMNKADPKYIRTGAKPAGTDIRLYDGGNLYVAAIGQAGNSKIAELRVRYKFVLCLPTLLNPTGGLADDGTVQQFVTPGNPTSVTPQSYVSGAPALLLVPGSTGGLGAVNTAGSIVPPAGDYRVDVELFAQNAGQQIDLISLVIRKNAVGVWTTITGNVDLDKNIAMSSSYLLAMNGTDTLDCQVQIDTGDASATPVWGKVILSLV